MLTTQPPRLSSLREITHKEIVRRGPGNARLMSSWILMSALVGILAGCGASNSFEKPKNRYYEATMIKTPAPKRGEKSKLIAALPSKLKGKRVFRIKGKRIQVLGGKINRLKELSHAELRALFIVSGQDLQGAELDLKVRLYGKSTAPVTVIIEMNGDISVEEGKWKQSAIPKSAKEIEARWGVGPLKVKRGAKWSKRALRSINIALSKLSKEERALLKGIPFVRKSKGKGAQAALYIQESDCDAIIQVFNRAIKSERYTFSGQAQSALPATVHPIVHEIGHALHSLPGRRLQCEYIKLINQYNKTVKSANKSKGAKRAKLSQKLTQQKAQIDRLKPRVEKWRNRGPVLTAYLRVKGSLEGPTPYGLTSDKESFAESFALYRVDPQALKRIMPKVYAWFSAQGHLKEARKTP